VYLGPWLKPARELAERQAAALANRPVWLFSSGPVGEPAKPADNPVDVTKIQTATRAPGPPDLRWQARQEAPQLPRPGHGLRYPRRRGRLPHWADIRAWAASIADTLLS
jgi:menaquinone-dependent protoporphyrinogen oxidase